MGIFNSIFQVQAPERRNINTVMQDVIQEAREVNDGALVGPQTALMYSAVWAAVRVISESVAMLPLIVYQRQGRGKRRATEHPLYQLLHDQPNDEMTSFEWRETSQAHVCLTGNAYSRIVSNDNGDVEQLIPLDPVLMEVERNKEGGLVYKYNRKIIPTEQVFHLPGLGYNGVMGYSVVGMARRSMGLGISMDEQGLAFYNNDSTPGGLLEHPGQLSEKAYNRLVESWEKRHQGPKRTRKLAVLEEGLKYTPVSIPPKDAQFLESRRFQISEMARWFRVPMHMLYELERATNNNIEHQGQEFLTYSLQPWLTRWEKKLTIRLLTQRERDAGFFIEHLVDALLRGDMKTRNEAYMMGRQGGWLSVNDIREKENQEPIENGDEYLVPLNMAPAGSLQNQDSEPDKKEPAAERQENPPGEARNWQSAAEQRYRLSQRQRGIFDELNRRILRRERNDIKAQAARLLGKEMPRMVFAQWVREFYESQAGWISEQARPSMRAYAGMVADLVAQELQRKGIDEKEIENFTLAYINDFGRRGALRRQTKLLSLIEADEGQGDLLQEVGEMLDGWVETQSEALGHEEAVRLNNAAALALYGALGVQLLRSVATGESTCPYCRALDGKVIGINEYFLEAGEFQPEGAERPLVVSHNHRHSPYHGGCDCMTVAG